MHLFQTQFMDLSKHQFQNIAVQLISKRLWTLVAKKDTFKLNSRHWDYSKFIKFTKVNL